MTRLSVLLFCAFACALSACHRQQEENVQARAENASRALEARYNELETEAEGDTNEAIAPIDNEADNLLSQMDNGTAANASVNAQ